MGACSSSYVVPPTVEKLHDEPAMGKVDGKDGGEGSQRRAGSLRDAYEVAAGMPRAHGHRSTFVTAHRATGTRRAIRVVPKRSPEHTELARLELTVMRTLYSPHVIKLCETFEDHRNIYMVTELCTGGDLIDCVIREESFSERAAAVAMQQILRGVLHMHEKFIAHRDLRPQVLLLARDGPLDRTVLKFCDLSVACLMQKGKSLSSKAGTPHFMAPEVLVGRYNHMCDLWSCGVVMFLLLSGQLPFRGQTELEVFSALRVGYWSLQGPSWERISENAKGLLHMLLKRRPQERCTAEQALSHSWFKQVVGGHACPQLPGSLVCGLMNFQSMHRVPAAASEAIARQFSEERIRGLQKLFEERDVEGSGLLTVDNLMAVLKQAGLVAESDALKQVMLGMEGHGSSTIEYRDFVAATVDRRNSFMEEVCWLAFSSFDIDGSGKITREKIQDVLSSGNIEQFVHPERTWELQQDEGISSDTEVGFDTFVALVRRKGAGTMADSLKPAKREAAPI